MAEENRTLWIRDPLDCADRGAAGGVVVDGTRILEKVPAGVGPAGRRRRSLTPPAMCCCPAWSTPTTTSTRH
ncbi:hypothetical protein [Microbulbifer taiwanensis]|uniref:hypothetical protein n=1 Tax=Microbulbifer taiwanensis TaxID=986746 RepID=UPI00361D732A